MKRQIVKKIEAMSGSYTPYTIFTDWVAMMALAIQNGCCLIHDKIWKQREQNYLDLMRKYDSDTQKRFMELCGLLILAIEETEMTDWLGEIYMESGCGSKNTGQFFTPFHLSYLCASCSVPQNVDEEHPLVLNEPSTGGGGMIIAAAKILKDRGINFQRCMDVVAQDLDWNGVYMTYVQLSLLGIKATIAQGDTLAKPYTPDYPKERVLRTPARMGVLG